jgi:F420-dependent oxidoreductase-like protein
MRICLMIEGQEGVSWDQWVALAELCEGLGFDALFRSDHYAGIPDGGRGALDAWTTLAAIGARTSTLRLGTLVSPVTFRHPALLAKAVVTADQVTGGRVELGMGAGWFELEHREFGFPFPPSSERLDILTEQVEIVHRMWDANEPEVSFRGTHYTLEGCRALPKPVQQPHPPLIFGGGAGPRSAALAAKWADEYNVNFCPTDEIRARRGRVLAAWEAEGRDGPPVFSFMTCTIVGSDENELHERAWRVMKKEGETGDPSAWLESVAGECVVGTVPQVLDRLGELSEAGVERIMMQHLLHDDLDSVRLIGEELIPGAARL